MRSFNWTDTGEATFGDFLPELKDSCEDHPIVSTIAWYCGNAGPTTHPVGQKTPNGWGLYDMAGNASEWVGSVGPDGSGYGNGPFTDYGAELDLAGFLEASVPLTRFVQWRGGGWNSWPAVMMAGKATPLPPNALGRGLGLRLAQTVASVNGDP